MLISFQWTNLRKGSCKVQGIFCPTLLYEKIFDKTAISDLVTTLEVQKLITWVFGASFSSCVEVDITVGKCNLTLPYQAFVATFSQGHSPLTFSNKVSLRQFILNF